MSEPTGSITAPNRRPAVARVINDRGVWLFAAAMVIGGGVLFGALESRRASLTAPAIAPEPDSQSAVLAPPPELALPPSWQAPPVPPQVMQQPAPAQPAAPISQPAAPARPANAAHGFASDIPRYSPPPGAIIPAAQPPAATPGVPAEVFRALSGPGAGQPPKADAANGKQDRVEATRLSNPATTVPKGTVMQAVLESALDSTRAGMARAIVSRDIFGFDGTKVLIPRGSRLIGEYKADVQQGQSRALIQWQRLMRPDGVVINLDSPSADPLGRAGIKGKVNGHFLARYGGAILQSALEIGDQVAVNKIAPGTTIYASPGLLGVQAATQGAGQQSGMINQNVQPTLTVKQGTSVSVFVARDLDFTSVEQ